MQVLDRLVAKLLQHMPLLQRLLDNIALLDVLLSFFQAVTGTRWQASGALCHFSRCMHACAHPQACMAHAGAHAAAATACTGAEGDFCRPLLQAAGPLAITRGRHPLLLAALRGRPQGCQANDAYVSPSCSLQLLTGPNMSGKSTYLKQVGCCVYGPPLGLGMCAALTAAVPSSAVSPGGLAQTRERRAALSDHACCTTASTGGAAGGDGAAGLLRAGSLHGHHVSAHAAQLAFVRACAAA